MLRNSSADGVQHGGEYGRALEQCAQRGRVAVAGGVGAHVRVLASAADTSSSDVPDRAPWLQLAAGHGCESRRGFHGGVRADAAV